MADFIFEASASFMEQDIIIGIRITSGDPNATFECQLDNDRSVECKHVMDITLLCICLYTFLSQVLMVLCILLLVPLFIMLQ